MKIIRSKVFISALFFVLGIGAVLAVQRFLAKPSDKLELATTSHSTKTMDSLFDQFYDDDFFGRTHDPFEQMRKMRKRMMKDFDEIDNGGGMFDSWYRKRFGGGDAGEVTKREDKDFIYYDIAIKDLNKEKLNVKVENGQITISGQVEKKSEENGNGSYFSSSFHRSFPAPPDVDADKVQMESSKDKLILKFPKRATH